MKSIYRLATSADALAAVFFLRGKYFTAGFALGGILFTGAPRFSLRTASRS
jgi:hypothetical protein